MTTIATAICDQSGQEVEPKYLLTGYSLLEQKYGEITFSCPDCKRPDGTGKYTKLIVCFWNKKRYRDKPPYFRTDKYQQHHKQCKYYTDNIVGENSAQSGEKEIKQRDANTMLDFRFPKVVTTTALSSTNTTSSNNSAIKVSKSNNVNSSIKRTKKDTETTEMLSKLVAEYKNNPDKNIIFPGKGECPVKEVFKRIGTCEVYIDDYYKNEFVFISSVENVDKYGRGFRFIAKEKINGYTPILYFESSFVGDCFDEIYKLVIEFETKQTPLTMYLLRPYFKPRINGQHRIMDTKLQSMAYFHLELENHS